MTAVTLVFEPTVAPIFQMEPIPEGLDEVLRWVRATRPECVPEGATDWHDLFPHDGTEDGRRLTGNELAAELAGRTCYHSYGAKAGRKSNGEYIAHTQSGPIPHRSIIYHPKATFFLGGISRWVSHELIRNYVGADREEEGSPSQESTRYTEHPGHFIVPPRVIAKGPEAIEKFRAQMQASYDTYLEYIYTEVGDWAKSNDGAPPKGLERKRIYEAAAGLLPMQAATSFVWTSNPAALAKLFRERTDSAASLEFARLANKWKAICLSRWPNVFPAA